MRFLAFGVSSVVSIVAFLIFLRMHEGGPDLVLRESDVEGALAVKPVVEDTRDPWTRFRYYVPEARAEKLFPQLKSSATRFDPWCGYIYVAHKVTGKAFAEHPDGKYEKKANSLGIRSEAEPREQKPDVRILIAGDSHVDGVCDPTEGYPALLQDALGAEKHEVLNAAHGGYEFFNYVGTLERFIHLELVPDLFVMTVYGGNDFTGIVSRSRYHKMWPHKAWPQGYREFTERQRSAKGNLPSAFGQCVGSAGFLHYGPEQADALFANASALTREMGERCEELGIEFLVVFLPSPSELLDHANRGLIERSLEHLELEPEALDTLGAMRRRYVDFLSAEGIAHVDLYSSFREHEGLLYWNRDLHLNLDGHKLAAKAVEGAVREVLVRGLGTPR
ncbi:MAG: SGNH/GDSL hydrolase family protein [bacterium]|nr:SGNH/GDSL hydrolase family protein [bacterium]